MKWSQPLDDDVAQHEHKKKQRRHVSHYPGFCPFAPLLLSIWAKSG